MRLVYKDTQREVKINDVVTTGMDEPGCTGLRVRHFVPPHKPSSSGKVVVETLYGKNDADDLRSGTREFYVGVIGAEWIEREDRGEAPRAKDWYASLDTAELARLLLDDTKQLATDNWAVDVGSIEAHCEVIRELHKRAKRPRYSVEILWGENPEPEDKPQLYTFNTQAELTAFMEGIAEGDGWMGYEVIYTDEEST